jgi:hypothetical protein
MNQRPQLTSADLKLELERVQRELESVDASPRKAMASGQDRLAILRRQAALGDLRDELARRRRLEAG